jgi:hypothetical protein
LDSTAIETELTKYNITDAAIAKLKDDYLKLTVAGINDKEGCKKVHDARMDIVKRRTSIEKKRVELKADSLEYGRRVDAEAKRITGLLQPIEDHLTEQEKIVTDELARIKEKKEAEEKARIQARVNRLFELGARFDGAQYALYGLVIPVTILNAATTEQFAMFLDQAEKAKAAEEEAARLKAEEEARIKAEEEAKRKAEEERLAKIAAQQEEERKRLEEASRKQKAEEERLQKQREEFERKAREEQEKLETEKRRIAEEQARKEAEERRQEEIKKAKEEAAEKARIEAEEKAKREAEEKAEAERKAKEDAERREALRPDKEKLVSFARDLRALYVEWPGQLATDDAKAIIEQACEVMLSVALTSEKKAKEL